MGRKITQSHIFFGYWPGGEEEKKSGQRSTAVFYSNDGVKFLCLVLKNGEMQLFSQDEFKEGKHLEISQEYFIRCISEAWDNVKHSKEFLHSPMFKVAQDLGTFSEEQLKCAFSASGVRTTYKTHFSTVAGAHLKAQSVPVKSFCFTSSFESEVAKQKYLEELWGYIDTLRNDIDAKRCSFKRLKDTSAKESTLSVISELTAELSRCEAELKKWDVDGIYLDDKEIVPLAPVRKTRHDPSDMRGGGGEKLSNGSRRAVQGVSSEKERGESTDIRMLRKRIKRLREALNQNRTVFSVKKSQNKWLEAEDLKRIILKDYEMLSGTKADLQKFCPNDPLLVQKDTLSWLNEVALSADNKGNASELSMRKRAHEGCVNLRSGERGAGEIGTKQKSQNGNVFDIALKEAGVLADEIHSLRRELDRRLRERQYRNDNGKLNDKALDTLHERMIRFKDLVMRRNESLGTTKKILYRLEEISEKSKRN